MFWGFVGAFLVLLAFWVYKRSTNPWGLPQAGFNWPLIGQTLRLRGGFTTFFASNANNFGPVWVAPLFGDLIVVLAGQKQLHTLVMEEKKGKVNQWGPLSFQKLFGGNPRSPALHAQFRKLVTPPLSRTNLEQLGIFKEMTPVFKKRLAASKLDSAWIRDVTFDIAWLLNIGKIGLEYRDEAQKAYTHFSAGLRTHQFSQQFKDAIAGRATIGRIVATLIEKHPEALTDNPNALLPVWKEVIENDAKAGEVKSKDDALGSITVGLMFASHDTLSKAYNGIFWTLINRPDLLARLDKEANSSNPPLKATDLDQSEYITHFIKETLRLYGAAGGFRECTEPITLDSPKITFAAGTKFYVMDGYDHYKVQDYQEFDPERKDDYKWAPFGGGVHNCLGRHFAIMQLKFFIYYLFQNYDVSVQKGVNPSFPNSVISDCHLVVTPKA